MGPGVDWTSFGRGGSRAIAGPTLAVVIASGVMVAVLLITTIGLDGAGAWVLRGIGVLLAVPVVMLGIRRAQVLARLEQMERTGQHPDTVVHATTPQGEEIEVIVPGAEQTALPRLGLSGLTGYTVAALVSGGLSFGIFLILGIARLASG